MGDRFPDNYAAKKAFEAFSKLMLDPCQEAIDKDWKEMKSDERSAWIAAAKAAYKAEAWVLSDQ